MAFLEVKLLILMFYEYFCFFEKVKITFKSEGVLSHSTPYIYYKLFLILYRIYFVETQDHYNLWQKQPSF